MLLSRRVWRMRAGVLLSVAEGHRRSARNCRQSTRWRWRKMRVRNQRTSPAANSGRTVNWSTSRHSPASPGAGRMRRSWRQRRMPVIGDCSMKPRPGVSSSRVSCEVPSGSKPNRRMWLRNSGRRGTTSRSSRLWIPGGTLMLSNGRISRSIPSTEVIHRQSCSGLACRRDSKCRLIFIAGSC